MFLLLSRTPAPESPVLRGGSVTVEVVERQGHHVPSVTSVASEQKGEESRGGKVTSEQKPISISGNTLGVPVEYPRLSRMIGEVGQVQISIKKQEDGGFSEAIVRVSSGHHRLDQSALQATRTALSKGLLDRFWGSDNALQITFVFRLK